MLTSGKQSGHPGNIPCGFLIWSGHTFHAGDLWHSARPLLRSTYKLPDTFLGNVTSPLPLRAILPTSTQSVTFKPEEHIGAKVSRNVNSSTFLLLHCLKFSTSTTTVLSGKQGRSSGNKKQTINCTMNRKVKMFQNLH